MSNQATWHHQPLDSIKLHCWMTEAHMFDQCAWSCYALLDDSSNASVMAGSQSHKFFIAGQTS